MKTIKNLLLVTIATVAMTLTGCNSKNDEPQPYVYMTFATLESVGTNSCSFSAQESTDSAPVIFTSTVTLDPVNFKVGDRYVIQYSTADDQPFTGGPITLYTVIGAFSGDVVDISKGDIDMYIADPLNVVYNDRTGKWVNLQVTAPLESKPEVFGLYVDASTLNAEYPDVYVCFKSDNTVSASTMTFFGSFDVSSILNLTTSKGFILHYKKYGVMQTKQYDK